MQWTSLNDLREKYLSFFEGKDEVSGRFGDVVVTFALR